MTLSNAEMIAEAREFLDIQVGHTFFSDWDRQQVINVMQPIIDALEELEGENEELADAGVQCWYEIDRLRAVINHAATVEDRATPDTGFYVIVGRMRAILESEDITR